MRRFYRQKQTPPPRIAGVLLLLFMGFLLTASAALGAQVEREGAARKELTLEGAVATAVANSPTLAAARARVAAAQAVVAQARAAYWPSLSAGAGASRIESAENLFSSGSFSAGGSSLGGSGAGLTGGSSPVSFNNPESYYAASLRAAWLIFDGFARKFSLLAARYGSEESAAAAEDSRRVLVSALALSFYRAQLARENMAISRADEEFNRRQMEEAKARRRAGSGSLSDVLNFTIQVNGAQSAFLGAKQDLRTALAELAALMGLSGGFPEDMDIAMPPKVSEAEMTPPDRESLVALALSKRPDIAAKGGTAARLRAAKGLAEAAYYPSLSLNASLDGERPHDIHLGSDDFGNSLGLTLSYNIFDGGLKAARVREAEARAREADSQLASLKLRVSSQVRQTLIRLETAQEKLRLQLSNLALVRQNRDLVQKEYAAGQASLVRLNEAQRDLIRVKGQLALAVALLRQAWEESAISVGLERAKELQEYNGK